MTADHLPDKSLIRAEAKARRASLAPAAVHKWSGAICDILLRWPVLRQARSVALFSPLPGEPDLRPLFSRLASDKRLALPRVTPQGMAFAEITGLHQLRPGAFGILAPPEQAPVLDILDVILIPGLAFDGFGTRLGFGKGFYDRFLPTAGIRVGVCFENALFKRLPRDPHDLPMAYLITEKKIYKTNSSDTQGNLEDTRINI